MKKYIPLIVFSALALFVPMFVTGSYAMNIVITVLLYAYLATAWNIVGGFAGQLSFGHAAFLAIGAYTSTILASQYGISPWIGMIIGGILAAIVAVLIGLPTSRLRGAYYAISTIAFATGLMYILTTVKSIGPFQLGGAEGLSVAFNSDAGFFDFQFLDKIPYYYILVAFSAIALFTAWFIERSKLGFYLTALREDEDAAKALGINVTRTKLTAAGISAFLTAMGGTFYAQYFRYLEPHYLAGPDFSNQMVFLAIVGGIGTVFGPFVGGLVLTAVAEYVRVTFVDLPAGTHLVIYGIAVLLVILYFPKGILEPVISLFKKIFRKKGKGALDDNHSRN